VGGRFAGPTNGALERIRRPGWCTAIGRGQRFYIEARSGTGRPRAWRGWLAPEGYGEIIGGGERLADLDLLLARLKAHNLPQERSSGTSTCGGTAPSPTAGFGMGIERVVAWICGLEHVRETIPYPRMLYRLYP